MMRANSDEHYVLDLCDRILNRNAIRQFSGFDFLLGDPGKNGKCRRLAVDGYYEDLNLVIEYWESQHTKSVPIMDKRQTVSGCTRREQRRIYDQRRKDVLPQNGIRLHVLDYTKFEHRGGGKLIRRPEADELVIRKSLSFILS